MTTYTVWYGSVAPSNEQAWWVLDDEREAKWGYLAAPAAGPFAIATEADAAAAALRAPDPSTLEGALYFTGQS